MKVLINSNHKNMKSCSKIYWFSLTEVIVATSILTLTIFWVYKLLGENLRLIWNTSSLSTIALLENNAKECLKYFWYSSPWTIGQKYSINFWVNNIFCQTGSFDPHYTTFSWVSLDSKTYFISTQIKSEDVSGRNWEIEIFEEWVGKKNIDWRQTK